MNAFLDKWQSLTNVKRDLEAKKWLLGTSGNISLKICDYPLMFLITAGEVSKSHPHDEEFIVVNERGERVFKESLEPSPEVLFHSLFYQETNAECVLHVHTIDNKIISEIYGDMGEVVFKNCGLFREHSLDKEGKGIRLPIVNSKEALPVLEVYKEYARNDIGAVLVKNHGITVWGKTIGEARQLLETMEFLISYQVKLLMIQGQQNFVI